MSGSYTIPPGTRTSGDNGHLGAHDDTAAILSAVPLVVFNVLNTAYAGGADPTGASDSSGAVQAAVNAAAAAGGGIVFFPGGADYQLANGVSYSGTAPLRFIGDGPQASRIRLNSTATSSTYFSITNTGSWGDEKGLDGCCSFENLSFHNDHYVGAFSDTNQAIYMSGVDMGVVVNCGFYRGGGSQRVNQAIVLNACNQVVIDACNIFAVVNGIAFTGYCQVNCVRDTTVWTPSGSRVSTAACVLYQGQTLGTHMKSTVLHDGDRGILWTEDSAGKAPHLFYGYDVEFNNHTIAAAEFDYGVHVGLTDCIFSGAAVSANVPGLVFGPGFQGDAIVKGCEFIGQPGHSVQVQAGTGFTFQSCSFGGSGKYKFAANTCDEINIAAGVRNVSIDACHFNVNANGGLGTANPPRSAVHASGGVSAVTLSNCQGAGRGYGGTAVVDGAGAVMKRGCTGLGLADSTTGQGSTVTGTTPARLSASFTIPANDMVAGKAYRFRAWGHGTQAAGSPVSLQPQTNVGVASLGTFTAGNGPAAGASFYWSYECMLCVTAVGGSGTLASNETFSWGGALGASHGNTSFTVNTARDNPVVLTANWSSSSGSPTISCDGCLLEPLQNYPAS